MKKVLLLFFVFLHAFCYAWDSQDLEEINSQGLVHILESISLYQGFHYEFHNNLVAHLEDGSKWKVHPDHEKKFRSWHMGDRLHVQVRTSFYFNKREHLFEFYNHKTRETVPVMLVEYPEYPNRITEIQTMKLSSCVKVFLEDGMSWELWGGRFSYVSLNVVREGEPVYMVVHERGSILKWLGYSMIVGKELSATYYRAYYGENIESEDCDW